MRRLIYIIFATSMSMNALAADEAEDAIGGSPMSSKVNQDLTPNTPTDPHPLLDGRFLSLWPDQTVPETAHRPAKTSVGPSLRRLIAAEEGPELSLSAAPLSEVAPRDKGKGIVKPETLLGVVEHISPTQDDAAMTSTPATPGVQHENGPYDKPHGDFRKLRPKMILLPSSAQPTATEGAIKKSYKRGRQGGQAYRDSVHRFLENGELSLGALNFVKLQHNIAARPRFWKTSYSAAGAREQKSRAAELEKKVEKWLKDHNMTLEEFKQREESKRTERRREYNRRWRAKLKSVNSGLHDELPLERQTNENVSQQSSEPAEHREPGTSASASKYGPATKRKPWSSVMFGPGSERPTVTDVPLETPAQRGKRGGDAYREAVSRFLTDGELSPAAIAFVRLQRSIADRRIAEGQPSAERKDRKKKYNIDDLEAKVQAWLDKRNMTLQEFEKMAVKEKAKRQREYDRRWRDNLRENAPGAYRTYLREKRRKRLEGYQAQTMLAEHTGLDEAERKRLSAALPGKAFRAPSEARRQTSQQARTDRFAFYRGEADLNPAVLKYTQYLRDRIARGNQSGIYTNAMETTLGQWQSKVDGWLERHDLTLEEFEKGRRRTDLATSSASGRGQERR